MKNLRVLLLDDGRQALPFLKSLNAKGHHVTLAYGSKISPGYFSRYPNTRLKWGDYFKELDKFTERMLTYVRNETPDVTLAVGDVSAGIISRNKEELLRYTHVTVPDYEIFVRASDKAITMAYCIEHHIPCPLTFFPGRESIGDIRKRMVFPVIAKPCHGIGAIGIHRFDHEEGLWTHLPLLQNKYGEMIIQEYIPSEGGMQYQAEAFLDQQSRMKVCVVLLKPRFFPIAGGTSTANLTIDRPDIQAIVKDLLEGLQWSGAADVDLILDPRDHKVKVLEINPRVTAGIKIGFVAGVDFADLHIRLALGDPIPEVTSYALNIFSRNIPMEIIWCLRSDRKMKRNTPLPLFKLFGKDICEQTFSFDDPLTFLGFTLGMVIKYAHPKTWRTKIGKDLDLHG